MNGIFTRGGEGCPEDKVDSVVEGVLRVAEGRVDRSGGELLSGEGVVRSVVTVLQTRSKE